MRAALAFSVIGLVTLVSGCTDPETLNVHPALPENIQFVRLNKSLYGNTPTLVANGMNTLSFFLEFFDKDMNELTYNAGTKISVLVNESTKLTYPYRFSTLQPGIYQFTLDGVKEEAIIGPKVLVNAIADESFDPIILPVVFHYMVPEGVVISEGVAQGIQNTLNVNLSSANKAFADQFNSYDPNRAKMYLSFQAATTDPDGSTLERLGLHLVQAGEVSFADPDDPQLQALIWNGNYWPPKEYLNVWVVPMDTKYSYGKFPAGGGSGDYPNFAYGVYLNQKHYANSDSHVLTHELGHLLHLYHVFSENCSPDPDQCSDTNAYSRVYSAEYEGGFEKVDCDGLSFVSSNYMDYYPSKNNTFTFQQRKRVWVTLDSYPFLPTPVNQSLPGGGRVTRTRRSSLDMPRIDSRHLTVY